MCLHHSANATLSYKRLDVGSPDVQQTQSPRHKGASSDYLLHTASQMIFLVIFYLFIFFLEQEEEQCYMCGCGHVKVNASLWEETELIPDMIYNSNK